MPPANRSKTSRAARRRACEATRARAAVERGRSNPSSAPKPTRARRKSLAQGIAAQTCVSYETGTEVFHHHHHHRRRRRRRRRRGYCERAGAARMSPALTPLGASVCWLGTRVLILNRAVMPIDCSSPSRYLTETGSWERQRFVVPTSHDRLEEDALAAEHRRSTSLALLQEYTRRSSSLSPEQPRRGKRGSGSPSGSRSPGSRHESPAAAAASAGAEPRSDESLPPIVSPSRREHGRQMGGEGPPTAAGTNHGGNDRRHRSVTPSLGQEPTVRGPVRGWASLSPDTSSAQHGCYGSGSSSTWYQRTRPNWYGLDGRTQHAV